MSWALRPGLRGGGVWASPWPAGLRVLVLPCVVQRCKRWRANTPKTSLESRACCFRQRHLAKRLKENLLARGYKLKKGVRPSPKPPNPSCDLGRSLLAWWCPVLEYTFPQGQLEQNRGLTLWLLCHTRKPEPFQSGSHKAA